MESFFFLNFINQNTQSAEAFTRDVRILFELNNAYFSLYINLSICIPSFKKKYWTEVKYILNESLSVFSITHYKGDSDIKLKKMALLTEN